MSTNPYNVNDDFDLPRQTSHCRVLVHSHVIDNDLKGAIDCSLDVIQCTTSKTIKGGGSASFILVPRRNYINYIFPNDWVNIYFDPGDGRGFIRTFFGFVDRIERSITVSGEGQSTTNYHVVCTDFTKAFDKTCIYFNPHISDRKDFVGKFSANLAGAQLRMKGVTAYGTPADIIMNLAHLLLGFGASFVMPPSYPVTGAYIEASRKFRQRWAKSRFSKGVQEIIGTDTITQWIEKLRVDAEALGGMIRTGNTDTAKEAFMHTADVYLSGVEKAIMVAKLNRMDAFESSPANANTLAMDLLLQAHGAGQADVQTGLAVEATGAAGIPGYLLDLIDFSFVEYEAIDGSLSSTPIWTQQGTLWSIMMSKSNDIINEMFCDLRPLSIHHKDIGLEEGGYSTEPDEHGYTTTDIANWTPPVRFVPALVMREYPFGTINTLNTREAEVLGVEIREVYIGAIFSKGPGTPGRKILVAPYPINDYILYSNPSATTRKHLDVVTLSVRDITSENIGRGDADVFNFIELYSDGVFGKHMKFLTQDLQPIATAISVARHGLRVKTQSTLFARFDNKVQNRSGVDGVGTRRKLARWVLMLDHWYQHNIEYLHGTMTARAFPEIRVGYRLDVIERSESYYVEGVNHNWQYPNPMTTSLTLSRGQRNDPYPVYIKPELPAFNGDRSSLENSRLGMFFKQVDPDAVQRALSAEQIDNWSAPMAWSGDNRTDDPQYNKWGENKAGYLIANADEVLVGGKKKSDPGADTGQNTGQDQIQIYSPSQPSTYSPLAGLEPIGIMLPEGSGATGSTGKGFKK